MITRFPAANWPAALGANGPFALVVADLDLLEPLLAAVPIAGLLSPAEQTRYASLTHPKRQRQWLGGRLAAKQAVTALLAGIDPPLLTALTIANDATGKPFVAGECIRQPLSLSISHSGDLAVALAAPAPCGIDIQQITPAMARVRQRFLSPAEEDAMSEALAGLPELTRLTMLWAAKEALRKLFSGPPVPAFSETVFCGCAKEDNGHLLLFSSPQICHNAPHPLRVMATVHDRAILAASVLQQVTRS